MTEDSPLRSRILATLEIVAIVAWADGELAAEEAHIIAERIVALFPGEVDETWIREHLPRVRPPYPRPKNWRSERLAELGGQLGDDDAKQHAFAIALEVAHAEGGIGRREVSMLAAAAQELGLDATTALRLLAQAEHD